MTRLVASLQGHFWTVIPPLAGLVRRPKLGCARRFHARIEEPDGGGIDVRAAHHELETADSVVVVLHGVGGTADSRYCYQAARAALRLGCSAVRVSLRGADGSGEDIYHAALVDDIRAVLQSRPLRRYGRVFLFGYSQGGLTVLHAAAERIDRRLAGVTAICPPLDLGAAMENFDRTGLRLHKYVMNTLANRSYAAVERAGRGTCTMAQLRRARTCAAWNELTIVPRFSFRDVNDYYRATSMQGRWRRIEAPTMLVFSHRDPIVPPDSIRPQLRGLPPDVSVHWLDAGGHIYFPASTRLGEAGPAGIENQCVAWLLRNVGKGGGGEFCAEYSDAVA